MNGPHENEFFEEDDEDLMDGQVPVVCNASRHTEKIEGSTLETQTWRMKERVSNRFVTHVWSLRCKCLASIILTQILLYH